MVMNKMREWTKWIMVLTALAFGALMFFEWGMDASGQSALAMGGGEMGRVNGDPISYEAWLPAYQLLYDQRQEASGRPLTSAEARQIEDETWEQLISQVLVRQELARRDIDVSDEEIRQAARFAPPASLRNDPLFQTDGQFDLNKYHQYLASPAVDPRLLAQLEAYYRDRIPQAKLLQQLATGVWVSDAELWVAFRDRNETAEVEYVVVDPAEVIADGRVEVSDDEVARYYRDHREDYRDAASAQIKIAAIDKTPTAVDTAAALERVAALRQEILEGADFADVATRESADPVSAQVGGDLGSFTRGQMVPAFDQAVFTQPVGELGEPVLSQFGYHLIEVTERDGDTANARHILIPIELTFESEDRILALVDSLADLVEDMPLDSAAARLDLATRVATIRADQPVVPGLGPLDEAVDWVFEDPESEEVPVSPDFENDLVYYVVEIVSQQPEGVRPLEAVADGIRARLVAERRTDLARAEATTMLERARSGGGLEALAGDGLEVRTAGPFTRMDFVPDLGQATQAIGASFGLPLGSIGGPFDAAGGRLVLLRAVAREAADRAQWEAQKDLQRARAAEQRQQAIVSAYLNDLREAADIDDNREAVLRPPDTGQQGLGGGLFGS
ncbi:MAG TPA: SurA N-terminal domain-containing protein [Longimicrobiales bacterium]|nr:SurA N-terminal domain-containing protein [Longimicrobiales bacterium]